MQTANIAALARYIEEHGHKVAFCDGEALWATSEADGKLDRIPATWAAVREWLGY